MITDVQITLQEYTGSGGEPLDKAVVDIISAGVTGATVSYGVNRLPVAQVYLDASIINVNKCKALCDFDQVRRKMITLIINSVKGCIRFDGMIDGLSLSQQPGNLTTSLILKHEFTLLNEIYPRIIGLSAGSSNMFAVNSPFTYEVDAVGQISNQKQWSESLKASFPIYAYVGNNGQRFELSSDMQVIEFIVQLCRAIVEQQKDSQFLTESNPYKSISNSLRSALAAGQVNIKQLGDLITNMIKKIDVSFTKGLSVTAATPVSTNASSPTLSAMLIRDTALLEETLFSMLVKLINQYNCVIVVGNTNNAASKVTGAYIIPESPYLKVEHPDINSGKQISDTPNVALPGDYESFSFNDSGDNTIKGVYVVPDPIGLDNTIMQSADGMCGFFGEGIESGPDGLPTIKSIEANKVRGNIVIKTLPACPATYTAFQGIAGSWGFQKTISAASQGSSVTAIPLFGGLINAALQFEEAYESMKKATGLGVHLTDGMQDFLNNWAQAEYCRIKYGDRAGSVSLPFNPRWVPGAPGTVYTKHPGTYVDFYVTDVTHSFTLSPPNTGNATTSVSFNGGRPGASSQAGLDTVQMYNYTFKDSQRFCSSFIDSIKP